MRLSIVVSTEMAQFEAATFKGSFADNLERIAALGYNGVELAIRDPSLIDVEQTDTLLRSYGLPVSAIGTGQAWGEEGLSFTDPDAGVRHRAIERVLEHLPLAAHWGAVVIIGLLRGTQRPEATREQAMAWLVEALRECCAAASGSGVRLALEPINRYETNLINTVAEGLQLLEQIAADSLGLLLDTFHMNIEEPDIEESIRWAGERIFHFHVADSNRWYPGAGHLNFSSILAALRYAGYGGWISGEFMPMPDAYTGAHEAMRHLRPLLETTFDV